MIEAQTELKRDAYNTAWDLLKKNWETKFVKFQSQTPKIITIKNWSVHETSIQGEAKNQFTSEVLTEDCVTVNKILNTTSNPLGIALYPHLKDKNPAIPVTLVITKIGDGFSTKWEVKQG